ncbi:MAG: 50S ribosomal protein L24 [Chloroflexi bacterium]|nr:50S ribosomal protein L24 [Chloroflexota bacterium]MBU1750908.1 50S ribosomal protein L24 [Chloroflexota bacterium]MBU1879651.1 50S ribosomal protein L24 [Chloroflexota bacterium]
MHIRKGDKVLVLKGKDRGKTGEVRSIVTGQVKRSGERDSNRDRAIVAGVNIAKRHLRPGRVRTQAGIVDIEASIHVANLALICPHCNKPARVGNQVLEDGAKSRVCRRCGDLID